ncbi:hypothetical protein I4U23_000143 [Adineta vaga]|nr:hypothetical protein I4U23_000143 [Adineta vaga]
MQLYSVTILLVLLGIQLIPTSALKCYQCDGGEGTGCYDKFSSNGIATVESKTGYCTKSKGEFLGIKSITRDAYTVNPQGSCTKNGCSKVSVPLAGSVLYCCCNTELCNSTGRLTSTMTIGIILSTLVLAFKKLGY